RDQLVVGGARSLGGGVTVRHGRRSGVAGAVLERRQRDQRAGPERGVVDRRGRGDERLGRGQRGRVVPRGLLRRDRIEVVLELGDALAGCRILGERHDRRQRIEV